MTYKWLSRKGFFFEFITHISFSVILMFYMIKSISFVYFLSVISPPFTPHLKPLYLVTNILEWVVAVVAAVWWQVISVFILCVRLSVFGHKYIGVGGSSSGGSVVEGN